MNVNKLKESILLIIKKSKEKFDKKLGRAEIMKLLYIVELAYFKKYNKTITGTTFKYYHYGPFSQDVLDMLDTLEKEGILEDEFFQDPFSGYEKHNYIIKNEHKIKYLNKDEKKFIDKVIEKFGEMTLRELLTFVYNIEPMKTAKKGDILIEGRKKGGD
jgi:uncharacterized phage-associated protein